MDHRYQYIHYYLEHFMGQYVELLHHVESNTNNLVGTQTYTSETHVTLSSLSTKNYGNETYCLACSALSSLPTIGDIMGLLEPSMEESIRAVDGIKLNAYIQQLELSRIRLNQMEQELTHARNQGMFFGGGAIMGGEQGIPISMNSISSDAAMFDVEYARWLEEHHHLVCELRAAVQEHLSENELRMLVDKFLTQYDQVMNLKSLVAKADY
uniref:BZIP transcription factor TGA10-like n=1 Tax=Cicer arietinum TaxID=3827 RepID=A0A3Q7XGC1_CICAR|nr:bZIP transcription factor TGA10-like [Cicer arietinum]